MVEVLGQDGHGVTVASSGREAIAKLETGPFDLILSDIRMPDLDGPALYRYLKTKRSDLLCWLLAKSMRGRTGARKRKRPCN